MATIHQDHQSDQQLHQDSNDSTPTSENISVSEVVNGMTNIFCITMASLPCLFIPLNTACWRWLFSLFILPRWLWVRDRPSVGGPNSQYSTFRGSDEAEMESEQHLCVRECQHARMGVGRCYAWDHYQANLQRQATGNSDKDRNHGELRRQRGQKELLLPAVDKVIRHFLRTVKVG